MVETLITAGHADAIALVEPEGDETVRYGELQDRVERAARALVASGVGEGDAVALAMVNGAGIVQAFLAIVAAGAAAAPLNPGYTEDEFVAYLEDLRPAALLVDDDPPPAALAACARLGVRTIAADRLASRPSTAALPGPLPDATALLLHTSGTTAKPKQVPIRQRNLAATAREIAAGYGLGPTDASHCVMPLFHVHGLVASTLATLASGGAVIVPRRFSASSFWADGARHGATWFSAVPTIHHVLLERARTEAAATEHGLRFARSCSSALSPVLMAEFEERFGIPLVEAYGMTEAAHQMASNPLPPGGRRPGSVGLPTGTRVAALDAEWRVLPADEVGEIAVRGAGVIDGYRDNPEANTASFRDGWFRTGDSGRVDADGYVWLAGRVKELINRAGEKISPFEVEDALLAHPAVAEAVAFAVPDAKYGEVVGAAVVLRTAASDAELRVYCGERLAPFKVPARIAVLDAIPKGPTGKVQRRHLRTLFDGDAG